MWIQFALVLFSCCAGVIKGTPGENFNCFPNQTIQFTNPNSSLYTYYRAFYDAAGLETECIVSTDNGNSNAYLDCSSTTATVTLYISDRNLTSGENILSRNSAAFTFRCMPLDSYNTTLTDDLNVNISETAESDTPEYNITSAFYDASSNIVTAATVGDTIYYVIKGPSEYNLKPLQCNATGTQANEHSTLIVDGCSQDSDLIGHFSESTQDLENHYNATFYVFKFYNSDTLTITCKVEVCTSAGGCSFSCGERRKRFVSITSEFKREVSDDLKMSTIGNSLRIIDAPFGGSTRNSVISWRLKYLTMYSWYLSHKYYRNILFEPPAAHPTWVYDYSSIDGRQMIRVEEEDSLQGVSFLLMFLYIVW